MMGIKQANINLVKGRINLRSRLFQTRPTKCRLEVIQPFKSNSDADITQFVENASQLELLDTTTSKLFIVRQEDTWSRINISKELFEQFVDAYHIFPNIWKSVLPLGFKLSENEFTFPGPSSRYTITSGGQDRCEISYILRRVEEHGRECGPVDAPWSIRHTVVYHQLNGKKDIQKSKSIFLLVSLPSTVFEDELSQVIQDSTEEVNPWVIHWLLVADSARGWPEYISWIEGQLQDRSRSIYVATVGDEHDAKSLTNYKFSLQDRQDLYRFEEYISALQIILPTMLENITRIRDVYQKWCFEHSPFWDHLGLLVEFDEYISDAKRDIQRVEVLKERLQATIRLLTDLLSYEEACMLNSLALESQKEGKVTSQLAFQSTKDAAAVKVLTIISLIYLPTTIVANFFSTEFVKANDGKMEVSPQSWILAAVALPLTSITLGLWWLCVRFSPPVHPGDRGSRSAHKRVWDIITGKDSSDLEEGLWRKEREYRIPPRQQTMEAGGSKPQAKMD